MTRVLLCFGDESIVVDFARVPIAGDWVRVKHRAVTVDGEVTRVVLLEPATDTWGLAAEVLVKPGGRGERERRDDERDDEDEDAE